MAGADPPGNIPAAMAARDILTGCVCVGGEDILTGCAGEGEETEEVAGTRTCASVWVDAVG